NHWDDGHLVWRHPEVNPDEAREFLFECDTLCNTLSRNAGFAIREAMRNVIPYVFGKMVTRRIRRRSNQTAAH
ncbi:MAG TPA: hypothetical protein VFA15_03560, partial [Nitrososphaera sp.]|nr:hypothetical protein [Nitrososphaera sp.]